VAQPIFVKNQNKNLATYMYIKFWDSSEIIAKNAAANNRPLGENLTNLVTLLSCRATLRAVLTIWL
jgi:hypothetical protein